MSTFLRVSNRIAWTVLCSGLLGGLLATGQVTTADVVGRVADSSGAVLPNTKVLVENLDTHDVRTVETNASGEYVITQLPIGRYSLRIEAQGFKTFNVQSLTLSSGDRTRVDALMEIGQISESVQVEAQAAALQSDSSTVGSLITDKAVQDLPINGRNFISLAQISAGSNAGAPNALSSGTRPDDRRSTSTIAVGAQGSNVNNYMVDGMDNNDRVIGTIVIKPSMDALAEFRVQTNTYTAEVGRTAGGVVNLITKSGSNDLHGSLYEYFRNDKLDAESFEFTVNPPKPEYRLNQFGGSVGGAIKKNKTFFFLDNEEYRQVQGNPLTLTIPTPAMRTGNFAGVAVIYDPTTTAPDPANPGKFIRTPFAGNLIPANRISSIGTKYVSMYANPSANTLANNYSSALAKTQDYSTMDTRVDQHFSDKDYFYARYSFNDTSTFVPGSMPQVNVNGVTGSVWPGGSSSAFAGPAAQRAQGIQLNYVRLVRSNLLFELKAGWTRYGNHTQPLNPGLNVSSAIGIPGANYDSISSGLTSYTATGYEGLGDSQFIPIIQIDNTFQYQGAMTYTIQAHTIKAGGGVTRRQFLIAQSSQPRGAYTFTTNATNNTNGAGGNAIASLLLGIPATVTLTENLTWPGMRSWEPYFYAQDDWRVSSKLTLNLGLRYDVFTPYTEVANRISNLNLSTLKIDIAGQNGVSPSAGVRTDKGNIAPRFGFAFTPGRNFVVRGGFGLTYVPGNYMSQSYLKNPPFIASYSFTNDNNAPTYNIAQGFPPATPVSVSNLTGTVIALADNFKSTYVEQFSLGVQKEVLRSVISLGYVGALTRRNVTYVNLDQPDPGPGAVQQRRPFYGAFPGLSTITYMNSNGTLNYHSLQATFEHRYSNGLTVSSNYTWAHALQSAQAGSQVTDNWKLDYSNSPLDVRHRWVLATSYALPFGKSLKGIERQVLHGWQVNGIAAWNTGLPFSVTNSASVANIGTQAYDRPNLIANPVASNPTIQQWFNTGAFVAQAVNTAGNAAPFLLYGPPQRHLDISLFKEFDVKERLKLQFRAESYNITNTPSFANPGASFGTAAFGVVSGIIGTPRQQQFALKLLF